MALTDLRLQNFRSYADDSFELSSGVNIIVGPNASGKTNVLEAILVLARGQSYRAKDAELIRFEAPWARLDAHDDTTEGTRTVKLESDPSSSAVPNALSNALGVCKKSFIIDDKAVYRLSQQKTLPAVVFEPNHLLLLSASPELRRNYLDDLIEQTVAGFGATRRQYRRVLAQRNALLKKGSYVAGPQLFVWSLRLSELAGKIVQERLALVRRINEAASHTYAQLARTNSDVRVDYVSSSLNSGINDNLGSRGGGGQSGQYESALLKKLEHNLERDYALGFTTAGPHREDIRVLLNGHTLQDTASRGETRTIILALKIIEVQLLESARGMAPLLLLDDVFSELDGARRQALTAFLRNYQTFITTTDADVVVQHFMEVCNIIPMNR